MELTVRTHRVRAWEMVVGARFALIACILIGAPALAPTGSNLDRPSDSRSFNLSSLLNQTPAFANEGPVSGGLNDWPDLFGDSKPAQAIPPARAPKRNSIESTAAASPPKPSTAAPRSEDPPFLDSLLKKAPLSAERSADSVRTSHESKSRPVQLASAKAEDHPAVSTSDAKPSKSKTDSSSRKGFVIKVEGDGKELVVYDAEGKEVLRKSRKKETDGTTITGAGKTMSNRDLKPAPLEVAKPKQENRPSEAPKPKLVFDTVKKGENLSIIASRYEGVTFEDLMRVNQIDNPHTIPAGTKIWIPCDGLDGVCHTAGEGETLSSLLRRYEIEDMREVCDLNGLDYYSTNLLNPGQMVILPNTRPKDQPQRTHMARAIRSDLSKLKGNVRWQWPVEQDFKVSSPWGRRVDPFSLKSKEGAGGPKPRFSMHHGIDLAVPVGTPVYAARDGEVIEVSRSRYGHGNMIKLRHEDGWCTVYSHNSELLKKEGDLIKQGDLIALSGNSGRSTGPHLHFEVRRPNQESVNPSSFLPNR